MKWAVPELWKGGECFIIGGGPSILKQFEIPDETVKKVLSGVWEPYVYSEYFRLIKDKHIIGVNNAYQLGNWLDVIFFGDCSWFLRHEKAIVNYPGLKVTCCPRFGNKNKKESQGIKYLEKHKQIKKGISDDPTTVSWNANSGGASISLARHFGVKRIILLGFDMMSESVAGDKVKEAHWHEAHIKGNGKKQNNPPYGRHLKGFSHIADDAKKMKLEIINANPNSKIDSFKKVALKDVV